MVSNRERLIIFGITTRTILEPMPYAVTNPKADYNLKRRNTTDTVNDILLKKKNQF